MYGNTNSKQICKTKIIDKVDGKHDIIYKEEVKIIIKDTKINVKT